MRIQSIISGITAILLSVVIVWGWFEKIPPAQLILLVGFTLFFIGGSLPSIYDKIPKYRNVGLVVIGVVGGLLILSGQGTSLGILAIALGIANGVDILYSRRKNTSHERI